MKKVFLSIALFLVTLPFFALELQHDLFLGQSTGLDTALVFGKNSIKNSVGIYFDAHDTWEYNEGYNNRSNSSYGFSSKYIQARAANLGVFYQFTWSPTFTRVRNVGIGMDLPLQIGICADSAHGMNLAAGLVPAVKFEFNKLDLLIGYRLSILVAEAAQGLPCAKSSCTIGVRYKIKKGTTVTSSGSSSGKKTSGESPENSDNQKVNVIPGTDIKTISN